MNKSTQRKTFFKTSTKDIHVQCEKNYKKIQSQNRDLGIILTILF